MGIPSMHFKNVLEQIKNIFWLKKTNQIFQKETLGVAKHFYKEVMD